MGRVGVDGRLTGLFPFHCTLGLALDAKKMKMQLPLSELVLVARLNGIRGDFFFLISSRYWLRHLTRADVALQSFSSQHNRRQIPHRKFPLIFPSPRLGFPALNYYSALGPDIKELSR